MVQPAASGPNPDVEFLNVDEVQTEDATFGHPVAAGRELLRRLGEKEGHRETFAIETTLSSTMLRMHKGV
jgi:hypothetical protein